jgi:hypothetical protein
VGVRNYRLYFKILCQTYFFYAFCYTDLFCHFGSRHRQNPKFDFLKSFVTEVSLTAPARDIQTHCIV